MDGVTVRVDLGERGYDVAVTTGDRDGLGRFARLRAAGRLAFVVTDENVRPHAEAAAGSLAAAGFEIAYAVVPPGEAQKSLASASALYDRLVEARADRRTLVVAVGGGVIGDLAGFVAATFVRGLPFLIIPTTLLAMVDSSIGGKVGVNHARAKNLIGAFHQPVGVWADTAALATLPEAEYRSGLAEVVKYGVILDPALFADLESQGEAVLRRDGEAVRHLVARCCILKASVVSRDEREESGLRAILNYGHTFAHAFETAAGYGSWLHGQAVAAGMMCASRLAERRGLLDRGENLTGRQRRLLSRFGLPTGPERSPVPALVATMAHDKKALGGKLRFVLPRRLGQMALVDDVPQSEVVQVLEEAMAEGPGPGFAPGTQPGASLGVGL
jgi:3-dehydroquinate synthase